MATHSSVLAWRIPGTAGPGGLPSMGSHRVRHDWSDLATAVAAAELMLSHEKLHFVYEVLVGLLWDHSPLSTKAWGKVTPWRGLGRQQSQFIAWCGSCDWESPVLPWASAPAGFVRSSLTPWSGLLLVFGTGVAVGGDLLVGRLGRVLSCKASSSLAAFHHPGAIAPSPGNQLAVPIEIEGAWKQEPWVRLCSSLVAVSHLAGPGQDCEEGNGK